MVGRAPGQPSGQCQRPAPDGAPTPAKATRLNHHSATPDTTEPRDSQRQVSRQHCDLAKHLTRINLGVSSMICGHLRSAYGQDRFAHRLTWGFYWVAGVGFEPT